MWNVCVECLRKIWGYLSTIPINQANSEKGYLLNLPKTFAEVLTEQFLQLWDQDLLQLEVGNTSHVKNLTLRPAKIWRNGFQHLFECIQTMYIPGTVTRKFLCLEMVFTYIHRVPRWKDA